MTKGDQEKKQEPKLVGRRIVRISDVPPPDEKRGMDILWLLDPKIVYKNK